MAKSRAGSLETQLRQQLGEFGQAGVAFPLGGCIWVWVKIKASGIEPQVLVFVSIYQGSIFGYLFLTQPFWGCVKPRFLPRQPSDPASGREAVDLCSPQAQEAIEYRRGVTGADPAKLARGSQARGFARACCRQRMQKRGGSRRLLPGSAAAAAGDALRPTAAGSRCCRLDAADLCSELICKLPFKN